MSPNCISEADLGPGEHSTEQEKSRLYLEVAYLLNRRDKQYKRISNSKSAEKNIKETPVSKRQSGMGRNWIRT